MMNFLLSILLIGSIALVTLAIMALAIALPGLRRWAKRSGEPMQVHVTVPVTVPGSAEGAHEPTVATAIIAPAAMHAEPKVSPPAPQHLGRAAIDVRLEACREVIGFSSSAGAVQNAYLVIENVGDGPAFELTLTKTDDEQGQWFAGLDDDCRATITRPIPALGPGKAMRFKAGSRDALVQALGDEPGHASPMIAVSYAAAQNNRDDQTITKLPIRVCTHGMALCALSNASKPSPASSSVSSPSKPASRNPFKPASKG